MEINLGISTCPNDTFIFMPLIRKLIDTRGFYFRTVLDDVEVLNRAAIDGLLDVVKVSYGVIPKVKSNYHILKSGGALGFGCGPIVVSKDQYSSDSLTGKKIALPGWNTTAFRIFKFFYGENFEFVEMRFDKIIPAVKENTVDAGILIHEGRFTYHTHGLKLVTDLGDLWEKQMKTPIPLGAILISNKILKYADPLNELIRESIQFSRENFDIVKPYVLKYSQNLEEDILKKHIDLFVNDFSVDITPYSENISSFIHTSKEIFV